MAYHIAPKDNHSIVKSIDEQVERFLKEIDDDEAFWVGYFDRIRDSLRLWEQNLPDIKPYYAIKCCDEPGLLKFLANQGYGFDCASQDEIDRIIKYGGDPTKIVFSHPLKTAKSLKYAKEQGVEKLVYDTEHELRKILKYYPEAEVYLRVKPKFTNAKIQLSNKFGAAPEDVFQLLKLTKELNANLIGFTFHVGSLCDDITTFKVALEYASSLKAKAEELGLNVCFIDIGGGFLPPNEKKNYSFQSISQAINDAIDDYFPNNDIEFIAEPGRFIGGEYMDLYLPVIGTRNDQKEDGYYLLKDGKCSLTCPSGYAGIDKTCEKCSSKCSTCSISVDHCDSCSSKYYLYNNQCVSSCPTNTIIIEKECLSCTSNCETCSSTVDHCETCVTGYYLYNNQCLSECPSGTVIEGTKCSPCTSNCETCSSTVDYCETCVNGYYLYNNQ